MVKKLFWLVAGVVFFGVLAWSLRGVFNQSVRLDEAQSMWVSVKSISGILKMNGQDVQAPLYAILLHFWMQFFGTDIFKARLMSLFFFVLTIPFFYTLIEENADRKTATLGVILFVLSPFIVWYSQEARTYTLLTLVTTINHLYFLRMFRSRGKRGRFGYFLSTTLGLYTHYFFVFLLISQGLFVATFFLTRKLRHQKITHERIWFLINYLFINLSVLNLFVPWLAYVYKLGVAANAEPMIPKPNSFNLMQLYLNIIVGFQAINIQALAVSLWPLFLMILFLVFTRKREIEMKRADYLIVASILPVLLVYLVSFYKPIFLPRYLILVIPSSFIIISWVLLNFGHRILSTASTGTMMLMLVSLNFQNNTPASPVKEDYRDAVKTINMSVTPRDIVAVTAPFTIYPVEYYYSGLAPMETIPDWNSFKVGPIPKFSTENLKNEVAANAQTYDRMFLILSYDQGYQNQIADYMDHNYQRLYLAKYPSNIEVRVYKLRYDLF